MVAKTVALGKSGVRDWLIQRTSAVIITLFILGVFGYFLNVNSISFDVWQKFWRTPFIQITSIITLVAILLHAWIGVWTVITDYVKCTVLRVLVQALVLLSLSYYVLWGIKILS